MNRRRDSLAALGGDIAAFQTGYDRNQGHAGFFDRITETLAMSIEVQGDKQRVGHGLARRHLINRHTFRIDGELQPRAVLTAPGPRRA